MSYDLYLCDNIVYLPTVYQVERAYLKIADPIAVYPIEEDDAIRRTIVERLEQGNPVIPMPDRARRNDPADILKYVKYKSWQGFARHAESWSVYKTKTGTFTIAIGEKHGAGAFRDDPARLITLPVGTTLDEVAARTVLEIQAKAREIAGAG